jgi:PTS system nitrogen regulatory IIA component
VRLQEGRVGLAIRAHSKQLSQFFSMSHKKKVMQIADYLDPSLVIFLETTARDTAIDTLIDRLSENHKLPDRLTFRTAIFNREDLVSTGIGMGIAVPHAKLPHIDEFFIAIGVQKVKGIDWNSLDKAPVRIIFMIGGPEHKQTEYLKILSMLTAAIKDVDSRKKILKANSAKEVISILSR